MKKAHLSINIWTQGRANLPEGFELARALAPYLEYIASLCDDGCLSGDFVDDRFRGWWSIREGKNVKL